MRTWRRCGRPDCAATASCRQPAARGGARRRRRMTVCDDVAYRARRRRRRLAPRCRRASSDAAVSHWQRAFSAAACAARVLGHDDQAPVAFKWPRRRAVRVQRVPYRVSQHAQIRGVRSTQPPATPPAWCCVHGCLPQAPRWRRVASLRSSSASSPQARPSIFHPRHVHSRRAAPLHRRRRRALRRAWEQAARRGSRGTLGAFRGARLCAASRGSSRPSAAVPTRRPRGPLTRPPPARAPPQRQACCSRWRAWSR